MSRRKSNSKTRFGAIIARGCERQGVSFSELSRRLGVSQGRVPEIVQSENLTERVLNNCARALGLEVEVKLIKKA